MKMATHEWEAEVNRRIAERASKIMRAHDWTKADVARRSGISYRTISRIFQAEISTSSANLARLCVALNTSPDTLVLPLPRRT